MRRNIRRGQTAHLPVLCSRRRCVHCSTKAQQVGTKWMCTLCKAPLCLKETKNCFILFHVYLIEMFSCSYICTYFVILHGATNLSTIIFLLFIIRNIQRYYFFPYLESLDHKNTVIYFKLEKKIPGNQGIIFVEIPVQ